MMQDTNIPTTSKNQNENEPEGFDNYRETKLVEPIPDAVSLSIPEQLLQLEDELCLELDSIKFTDPVAYIYSPLRYAHDTHAKYVHKFCGSQKNVLFLGMNPGPYGMVQNGVPFGECNIVRDWMKIDGVIGKPPREHPKHPILGLGIQRSEVSGKRFWALIKSLYGTPERFFKDCYVQNLCPLAFYPKTSGAGIRPEKLNIEERKKLLKICNLYFLQVIQLLQVKLVICIGNFAYDNASKAVKDSQQPILASLRIEKLMHPSPANPKANNSCWQTYALDKLKEIDIEDYTDLEIDLMHPSPANPEANSGRWQTNALDELKEIDIEDYTDLEIDSEE